MSPENRVTKPPQLPLNEQYLALISSMRSNYEKGMISYLDSDVNNFYIFCTKHPEYIPNNLNLDEFTGRCNLFIQKIWELTGLNQIIANQSPSQTDKLIG